MENNKPVLTLTPTEAKQVQKYIREHPNEYIEFYETLGLGIGYTLEITTDNIKEKTDITDYDSF